LQVQTLIYVNTFLRTSGFPADTVEKAVRAEFETASLSRNMMEDIKKGTLKISTAQKVLKKLVEDINGLLKEPKKLDTKQNTDLEEMKKTFESDHERVQDFLRKNDDETTELKGQWATRIVSGIGAVNKIKLVIILGKPNAKKYSRIMNRVTDTLARRISKKRKK